METVERAAKASGLFMRRAMACTYVELGRLDDAKNAMRKQLELAPHITIKWFGEVVPYRLDEIRTRIHDGLRKAGMPEG